jgi:hypothetical protein
LTLHRWGLFEKLGVSFKTTNVIESIQARLGQYTDKVDYWRNSDQKQRWVAAALSDLEPRLRRVKGMKYLPELRLAIQRELRIQGSIPFLVEFEKKLMLFTPLSRADFEARVHAEGPCEVQEGISFL